MHEPPHRWLRLAEVIDALRVMPRLLLLGASIFTAWYAHQVTHWMFGFVQLRQDLGLAEGIVIGVLGVTVPAVTGVWTAAVKLYLQTGRQWGGAPPS